MNHPELQYLNTLEEVLRDGEKVQNRTGVSTRRILGITHRYPFDSGFPLLTTKNVWLKGIVHELLWFISGSTNIKYLVDNGVKIWNDDAYRYYTTNWSLHSSLLSKEEYITEIGNGNLEDDGFMKYGDMGPIYGKQWRNWNGTDQLANLIEGLKNNPTSRRHILTAWNVDELDQMSLPPCFPPGSRVRTDTGYVPIEEIKEGDNIFTSEGNWMPAYDIKKTPYTGKILVEISCWYNNEKIVCTPNHPFLIKDRGYVEAKDIKSDDYLAIRRDSFESIVPTFYYDVGVNQYQKKKSLAFQPTLEDVYMMGYFLGDGWTMPYGSRCCFAISHKDKDKILPRIRKSIKISEKPNCGTNVSTYQTKSKKWHNVLSEFGHKAHNKRIPSWIFSMPREYIEKFIEGYKDADGHKKENGRWDFTTTSEQLAYGLQSLFAMLGQVTSIQHQERPDTTIIEGRVVNQRNTFSLKVVDGKFAIVDDNFVWVKVHDVLLSEDEADFVYNFSVDEDHTYTINNFVTHNCHLLSQYTISNGKLWCHMYQRSCDIFLGVPFNIASYSLLTYMIAQCVGIEPGGLIHTMHDAHIYVPHIPAVEEQLKRAPRKFPKLVLNPKINNIDDFKYEDIKIEGYNSHSKIKADLFT